MPARRPPFGFLVSRPNVWTEAGIYNQTPIPATPPPVPGAVPLCRQSQGFYPKAAMTALDYALKLIKKWEGCRLTAYPDPATGGDPWTIGWGSTGKGIGPGVQWTLEQADDRLARDVGRFMAGVRGLLKVDPEPNELGAMTSLAYNIGLGNFRSSTLLRKFNAGDKAGAAAEFGKWNRAAGKVMKGLTNRRADERQVFVA